MLVLMLFMSLWARCLQASHNTLTPLYEALNACDQDQPLGLSTGAIEDWQISASSTFPSDWDEFCSLKYARLYSTNNLAWCSKFKSSSEWLQIDLGLPTKVTGLMTQGRGDGQEWVSSYMLSYSLDTTWSYVLDVYGSNRIFMGNSDSYKVKHSYLDKPIVARYLKMHVLKWHGHPSLRVEVMGCQVCKQQLALPPYVKITASSSRHLPNTCQPHDSHLLSNKAWCPRLNNQDQWLQFDIGPATLITGLVTKGKGDSTKKHWVSKYLVSYSNDSNLWFYYKEEGKQDIKEFVGNQDKESTRTHYLNPPIVSRFVRLHPVQWNHRIAMRAGLLGCAHNGECGKEFVRIADNSPCVENLSFRKESWINTKRHVSNTRNNKYATKNNYYNGQKYETNSKTNLYSHKYHTRHHDHPRYTKRQTPMGWMAGEASKAVDGDQDEFESLNKFTRSKRRKSKINKNINRRDGSSNRITNQSSNYNLEDALVTNENKKTENDMSNNKMVKSPTCTVLDNLHVDKPTWMVDLGKKSVINGVLIYSLDTIEEKINFLMNGGSDAYINSSKNSTIENEEKREAFKKYINNLDRLTVFVDSKAKYPPSSSSKNPRRHHFITHKQRKSSQNLLHRHKTKSRRYYTSHLRNNYATSENVCGLVSRINDAVFRPKLNVRCNQEMKGRYVYIEADGLSDGSGFANGHLYGVNSYQKRTKKAIQNLNDVRNTEDMYYESSKSSNNVRRTSKDATQKEALMKKFFAAIICEVVVYS